MVFAAEIKNQRSLKNYVFGIEMVKKMISLTEYFEKLKKQEKMKVVISVDQNHLNTFGSEILEEAKKATVGRHTAYKHQPHFQGGEYHGHCDLPNGRQLSWTLSGKRLHPNKFPANDKIPKDAKNATANVLGVFPSLLEGYISYDEIEKAEVILFELKGKSKAARLLEQFDSVINTKNERNEA